MARRGFGTGSVYRDAGRGWAASVSLGKDAAGRRVRKVIRGKTRQEVEAKIDELLALRAPPTSSNVFDVESNVASAGMASSTARMVCVDSRGVSVDVLLDAEDVPLVQAHGHKWTVRWRQDVGRYQVTARTPEGNRIPLGRFLLGAPPDLEVDFINGDTLDHCRANLRLVNHAQNQVNQTRNRRNKTGVVGVTSLPDGRFSAQVCGSYLGTFDRLEDAARAVQQKRQDLFEFLGR